MSVQIFDLDGHDRFATVRSLHRMRRYKNSLRGLEAFGDVLDDLEICDKIGTEGCAVVRGILTKLGVPYSTEGIKAKVKEMGKDKFCQTVVDLAPSDKRSIAATACSYILDKIAAKVDSGGSTSSGSGSSGGGSRFAHNVATSSAIVRGMAPEQDTTVTTAGWRCQGGTAKCVAVHVVGTAFPVGGELPMSRCLALKNPADLRAGVQNPRPLEPPKCKSKVLPIAIGGAALLAAGLLVLR